MWGGPRCLFGSSLPHWGEQLWFKEAWRPQEKRVGWVMKDCRETQVYQGHFSTISAESKPRPSISATAVSTRAGPHPGPASRRL